MGLGMGWEEWEAQHTADQKSLGLFNGNLYPYCFVKQTPLWKHRHEQRCSPATPSSAVMGMFSSLSCSIILAFINVIVQKKYLKLI